MNLLSARHSLLWRLFGHRVTLNTVIRFSYLARFLKNTSVLDKLGNGGLFANVSAAAILY